MKSRTLSLVAGAGAASLLLLAACQQNETPVQPLSQDAGAQAPISTAPGAETVRMLGEGRPATEAELARYLAERKEVPGIAPADVSTPLAKAAALPVCRVNYNNSNSLAAMSNQANQGNTISPHYTHPCNTSYSVYHTPLNYTRFKLIPEDSRWCAGPVPLIGYRSGAYCISHTQGKLWPRRAGNFGGNTGVELWVENATHFRDFDLRSIYVHSGTVEIEAYRPGIGLWYWYPLTAGTTWTWPVGTRVSNVKVWSHGRNGYVQYDNLDIAIHP